MTTANLSVWLRARLTGLLRNRGILQLTAFDTATVESRSNERIRRASLSAATSAAAKGIALVTTAISVPLTLGYLGSDRFGVWMTLSALIALLGFADLGIGNSLLNGVARALGREDWTLIRANISSGIVMLIAVAVGFGLLFATVYGFIPWGRLFGVASPAALNEAGPAAAVLIVCFLVGIPAGAFQQVRVGLQQGYINSIFVGAGNIGGLALVIWAIQMRLGLPWLVLAMAGAPVLATLANGFALVVRSPWLRPTLHAVDFVVVRSLFRTGLSFLVLELAFAVAWTSNSVIIAAMLGPSAVAEYAVVSKLFMIPTFLVSFAIGPLWPAYREALSHDDVEWVRRVFGRSIRLSVLVAGSVSATLMVIGLPVITVWVGTSSVHPSLGLVTAMGIWTILNTLGYAVSVLLNGVQAMRFQVVTASLMATASVLLSIALTSRIGIAGVVWGGAIAIVVFELFPMAVYVPRLLARLESDSVHPRG